MVLLLFFYVVARDVGVTIGQRTLGRGGKVLFYKHRCP